MKRFLILFIVFLVFSQASCTPTPEPRLQIGKAYAIEGVTYKPKIQPAYKEIGYASWYGGKFHKRRTANGDIFDKSDLTGAHKTLPLPSIVKVTNLANGKVVEVKLNDRGPFIPGRIIDVSERAAKVLGFKGKGTARVSVELDREASLDLLKDPKLKIDADEKKKLEQAYLSVKSKPLKEDKKAEAELVNAVVETENIVAENELVSQEAPSEVIPSNEKIKIDAKDEIHLDSQPKAKTEKNAVAKVDNRPKSIIYKEAHQAAATSAVAAKKTVKQVVEKPKTKKPAVKKAGKYSVQVATTTSKKEAQKILAKVKDLSGEIKEVTVKGKKQYKIKVAGIENKEQAQAILSKVQNKGIKNAIITKK